MSRDGSGNYTRVPGSAYTNGTIADGAELDAEINDIATALTQSLAKDGQTVPTANLPMGGFKHTNVNTASARTEYARASQVQDGTLTHLTSVSGADTITASAPIGLSAYATGQKFSFVSAGANTGAVTLNINAIGAKSVTKDGTTALAADDIVSGAVCVVVYDGTQFQLVTTKSVPAASETVSGRVELATAAEVSTGTDTTRAVTPATLAPVLAAITRGGSRQTALSGPVDSSGLPAFGGSTGSTTVTASGTLIVTAANGWNASGALDRVGSITNPSWTGLSTNGAMYLYLDIAENGACTPGGTTLAPIYQWGGVYGTTSGQNTYNIQEAVMKVGNGSTASQVYRVFVGEVTVSGGVVTAITWYALMGRYDSGLIATLTGTGTNVSANHNLGVTPDPNNFGLAIECVVSELGYAVGDRIMGPLTGYNGNYEEPILTWSNTKTIGFSTNNSVNWRVASRLSPGTLVNTTASNWKYRLFAARGW